MEKNIALTIA